MKLKEIGNAVKWYAAIGLLYAMNPVYGVLLRSKYVSDENKLMQIKKTMNSFHKGGITPNSELKILKNLDKIYWNAHKKCMIDMLERWKNEDLLKEFYEMSKRTQ